MFRPVSSRVVLQMSQKLGEIGVGAIGREPSSSIGRCAGKQATDGGSRMIGAGRKVTVGKELGGKSSASAIREASTQSGRNSGKKRWVEFGGEAGEGKGVKMKGLNIGGDSNGVNARARKIGNSEVMVADSAGSSKDRLRDGVERIVDIESRWRLRGGKE